MIFPELHKGAIVRGEKTRHSVPYRREPAVVSGRSYVAQTVKIEGDKRSYRTFAQIKVVRRPFEQLLHEVTEDEAQAEGFPDRGAFFKWWRETHERVEAPASEAEPVARIPIWVVTFELDKSHQPRLLHKKPHRGYTTNPHEALRDEPEAVDELTLKVFAQDNRGRHKAFTEGTLSESLAEQKSLEGGLRFLREQARTRGVNISSAERVIERQLKAIQQKIEKAA